MKKFLLLIVALLFVTLSPWAQPLDKSVKKVRVHEQMSSSEQIFNTGGGATDNYGSPPFDNPNYYYAAIKTAPAGVWYRQAGLSPDGTKLIAQKSYTDATYSRTEIVLMNADGSGETIISAGNSDEGDIYGYMNPFWSDDGSAIGFAEVHKTTANKIVRYVISTTTSSYIYEPATGLDAQNPDFIGNSTTAIVFWDWIAADGAADLFTWDGSTLTNITNSTAYSDYEPVSNSDGTVILYWSGETTDEPINTTHTLTYISGVWTKDNDFAPIVGSYWPFWSGRADNYIGASMWSSSAGTDDIYIYDDAGSFVLDLTGPGYTGGSGQWNFIGGPFEGVNGEIVMTTNAGRTSSGRDIVFATPRTKLYVNAATGNDLFPGTINAPFLTIGKAITEAVAGGTVNVAAGTYSENIDFNKSIKLYGPNYNVSPVTGTRGLEAIITTNNRIGTADPVEIKGFEFTYPGGSNTLDQYVSGTVVLEKNYFHNVKGLFFANPLNISIIDNLCTFNANDEGIFLAGNYNGTTGTYADIHDNKFIDGPATGFNLSSVHGIIYNNTFDNILYYGVLIANTCSLDIYENIFKNITNPNPPGSPSWGAGIRFYQGFEGGLTASIHDNTFTNNYNGISARPAADFTGSNIDVSIHNNTISGNTNYNILHQGTGTLNATCNWFGTPVPSEVAADISGSVTYIPYQISEGGACTGGPVQLWRSGLFISAYATIQNAIDAAIGGDVIKVYPGTYDETAVGRGTTTDTGPYQFGLFFPPSKPGITLQGVKADGTSIVNAADVAALITTNATNTFGYAGVFVSADDITIRGLEIGINHAGDDKTIEVLGDNFNLDASKISAIGGLYIGDYSYNDNGTPTDFTDDVSSIQSYTISNNVFSNGGGVYIANGAGWTGSAPASVLGRSITGNTINDAGTFALAGPSPGIGWLLYPVGAATITGNTFAGANTRYLQAWGTTQAIFPFASYWNDNTYPKKTITTTDGNPDHIRGYDILPSFINLLRIGAVIQNRIDNAQPGDVVLVGAGTYTEQVHVILNNLTIQGSGKANTFIKSPASLALSFNGKKPVVFVDGVASCTMNDLTVDGDGKGNANYSFLGVAFWNAGGTLSNVDVLNVRDTPFSGAQHGVGVYAYNNITGSYLININDVTVTNFQKNAFALSGNGLTVNMDGVIVTGAGSTSVTAQNGIQVGFGASGTIANSSVTGIHYMDNVPPLDATATGVLLYDAGTVDMDNVQVTNSQTAVYFIDTYGSFNNSSVTLPVADVWADGVDIYFTSAKKGLTSDKHNHSQPFLEQYSGKPYLAKATTTIAIDNTTLTGNNYTGNMGISVYAEGNVDLTVTNSDVTNWDYGVNEFEDGGTITSAVNQNDLSSNNLAFWTNAAAYQDATCNYYGTTDPLVVQSKIEGNVTFLPFWTTSTGPCDGLGPVVNVTQSKSYMNIKPAVLEAVDNDFIEVAEGTYTESGQINIDKNLTITGANKATTIIKPAASFAEANYKDDASAWFLVNSGKTFNLSNVTLDGTGKLVCNAILSHGHGTIDNNIIKNIEHDQSTHYDGAGVALYSSDMTVSNNTLSGIGREGIFAAFFSTATITGNTYTGKGSGNWLDYGIEVGRNSTATISGNTISGNIGVATDLSTSAGILVTSYYDLAGVSTGATISNNSITGNYQGIAVGYDASDVSIVTATHNKIYGNTDYGVFSTGVTVDATLNWWGSVTGPTHATNQCGTGDAITDHVTYSPWYTNEGMTTTNTANVHKLFGTVKYANNAGTPLNGIKVTLRNSIGDGIDYITDATPGYYEFNGLTNDTYSLELSSTNPAGWGTWGGVNNTDYLLVLKHTIPPGPLLPAEPPVIRIAADVKSPAYPAPPTINGTDATAIKNAAKYGWFIPPTSTPWFDIPRWVFSGTHSSLPLTGIVLNCANVNTEIKRSILGLCAGDVNASYLPPSGPKSAQPNLDLVNRGSIAAANEITIPVRADMDMELGAITLFLDYDASMLEITGVTMPKQGNDAPYFLAGNNVIQIGWVSLEPVNVAMGETVLVIHGKVKNSNPGMIRFTLNSNPLSELANGEGVVIPGRLAIADIGGTASNDMISVYPNPAKDVLNIEYLMDETGTFRAELRNAQGIVVGTINNTTKPAGSHQEKLNVSNLPSGVYMLRVFRGSNINTQKIIINR